MRALKIMAGALVSVTLWELLKEGTRRFLTYWWAQNH